MTSTYKAPLRDRVAVKIANGVLRLASKEYRATTSHMLNIGFRAVVKQATWDAWAAEHPDEAEEAHREEMVGALRSLAVQAKASPDASSPGLPEPGSEKP